MTVCVATLCNNGSLIVGASDRMFTISSGHKWEPHQTKLANLTSSIVAMVAADSVAFPLAVLYELQEWVNLQIGGSPQVWLSVRHVTEKYCEIYREHRQKMAEVTVLSQLNLTLDTFVRSQHLMKAEIVTELWEKIKRVRPQSEVLFAGIDTSGAHLYVATNDIASCEDAGAFTAIGEGADHAVPYLASARYGKNIPGALALYLTYGAKRRGELFASVGEQTDMFSIGPAVGSFQPINQVVIQDLKRIYDSQEQNISRAHAQAQHDAKAYWDQIMQASAQAAATAMQSGTAPGQPGEAPTVEPAPPAAGLTKSDRKKKKKK